MINTFNESNLHNTLKKLYAYKYNGKTEFFDGKYYYDILTPKNEVIEIQTKNLSKLLSKLCTILESGKKITLVHPIVITKTIITTDCDNNIISKRKSPKKGSIYDLFSELTGIYPILLNENFTLEILEINMSEIRTKTNELVQSQNKKRRIKKDWNKTNKKLDEILSTRTFKTKEDYLSLLPQNLPKEFSAKELSQCFKQSVLFKKNTRINSHLIIWVLKHMELIEFVQIKNRSHYYKINTYGQGSLRSRP